MRAARISSLEGPRSVTVEEVETPPVQSGHVLIDVHAAGVNFPDVLQTRGLYQMKPDLPFTPGSEVAGVVREVGAGAPFAAGDRVVAFSVIGGCAESVAVPAPLATQLPDAVDFVTAAALPMNYLTVHFALVRRARLEPGETVLVHGAAGGVGTAAIQMAKALGARVVAVVSTEEKGRVAKDAGADEAILADGFLSRAKELTHGRGVDVIVDPVGGDRFTDSLRSLAPEGRLLVIGFTGGTIPEVKVNRLLLGNTSVVGVGWGAFWMNDPGYLASQWAEVLPLVEAGALTPPIGSIHPLDEVAVALAEIDERRAVGKVILRVR